jgi:hypothetical protein
MGALRKAAVDGKEHYFDKLYGYYQIHLQILGIHPDYMCHGYGNKICKWGMSKAVEDQVVLSLMASLMGQLLYRHFNSKNLGTVTVQALGDDEKVYMYAIVLDQMRGTRKCEFL